MSSDLNPRDQRGAVRKTLSSIVQVFDTVTGERIGHIGNISESGVMIIGPAEMVEGNLYQMNFTLPEGDDGPSVTFHLGAHCLWCSEAESTGTWWAGFEIIDINDQDADTLSHIVVAL